MVHSVYNVTSRVVELVPCHRERTVKYSVRIGLVNVLHEEHHLRRSFDLENVMFSRLWSGDKGTARRSHGSLSGNAKLR